MFFSSKEKKGPGIFCQEVTLHSNMSWKFICWDLVMCLSSKSAHPNLDVQVYHHAIQAIIAQKEKKYKFICSHWSLSNEPFPVKRIIIILDALPIHWILCNCLLSDMCLFYIWFEMTYVVVCVSWHHSGA